MKLDCKFLLSILGLLNLDGVQAFSTLTTRPGYVGTKLQATSGDRGEFSLQGMATTAAVACSLFLGAAVVEPSFATAAEDNQCVVHRLSDDDVMQGKRHPDLRMCDLSEQDISKTDLIGVVMEKTSAINTSFVKARLCKGILKESNFDGADFTSAIVDRVDFSGSSLRGAIFTNADLTGTSFKGADIEDADFSEANIKDYDIRGICRNPTLKGKNPKTGVETVRSLGCDSRLNEIDGNSAMVL
eukprot:CAMPEP_0116018518 /NCGR_PEP_ID=MMETSP0321-20121206/8694_1 /TAXON_ID=163516 /ORGANISM="Leptocylindrus danicus var. danicus, Strain B650" /LENGTH=242 /DNA_ID=CAMNT_0003488923 /DNA_START=17 /DNA_END=745 /DNA_ORIENTATION=-